MPSLSYREKSLYASLVAEVLVYGAYFVLNRQNSVNHVAGLIAAIIALQVIVQLLIALFTRNRVTDERDSLIELRGYRAGYRTIAAFMVVGLAMLWFHTARTDFNFEGRRIGLHILNVFISMLVIADITKTVTQIVSYRRAV
jgi:hypothetical protein